MIALTDGNGLLTSVQEPREALLAFLDELHVRTTFNPNGTSVCRCQRHSFDFVLTTPFFWIGHTLWTAPESTVIPTKSCTCSTEFTSVVSKSSWIDTSTSNLVLPLSVVVTLVLFLFLHVFRYVLIVNSSACPARILLNASRYSSRFSLHPSR